MQGNISERNQGCSESEGGSFEEMMSSAFQKGVLLLKELDSDGSRCRESMVTFSGPSSDAEGINEVPKNVTLLELDQKTHGQGNVRHTTKQLARRDRTLLVQETRIADHRSLTSLISHGNPRNKDYPKAPSANGFQRPERELYGFKGIH
ncbi:hypothetical protein EI94DRAFT_1704763 [Lactarius quietus]|nr:hypothetical protein EI94DRAFT_1704763 [Lactarius quietus]